MNHVDNTSDGMAFLRHIPRIGIIGVAFWLLVGAGSLTWNLWMLRSSVIDEARHEARATFRMDWAFWEPLHGKASIAFFGLPTLNDQMGSEIEYWRFITTAEGRDFALANAARFGGYIHRLVGQRSGVRIHRTSLHPLGNSSPDNWEMSALRAFEHGSKEISSVEMIEDHQQMRLMHPLKVERSCTKCHGLEQVGDIRGGISVSVPIEPLWAVAAGTRRGIWVSHLLAALCGSVVILLFTWWNEQKSAALNRSQRRYVMLTENLPVGVYRYSPIDDRFLAANSALIQMFRFESLDDFLNTDVATLYADQNESQRLMNQLLLSDTVVLEDVSMKTKDGMPLWTTITARGIHDTAGNITFVDGLIQDVTEQKTAAEERNYLHDRLSVQRQLVESSRQAGMAEVATCVLHNVGNVLNSVNVSSNLIAEALGHSSVTDFAKAATLIEEHQDDLATYVTQNERGKHLAPFLIALSREMTSEKLCIEQETQSLLRNVQHIKNIVALQQAHAGLGGVVEPVDLSNLIDEALNISGVLDECPPIEIVRDEEDLPHGMFDKHKLFQILINLFSNAKHALRRVDRTDKRLVVRLECNEGDRVRIEIQDNGPGIAAEHIVKIFAYRFTTKENGHGFGLHGSALFAKELGGSLTVDSAGIHTGATFTLELPFKTTGAPQFAI